VKLIELKGVSKRFGKNIILEDVNLSIEEGDILGVVGQSGSGKTTLLNLISGFIQPSSGKVLHSFRATGKQGSLSKELDKIKKLIGYAPQHNSFYPKLSVVENMLHFGQLYGIKKPVLRNNIISLLNATELYAHRKKLAEQLSGGMQKRLDISCSLVHKPRILLLDEPTGDLDIILQREIMNFIQEVNKQGVTLVLATHQLDLLEKICNKVIIIHKGKVIDNGLIEDIRKPFLKEDFTISLSPGENKERMISILKTLPVENIIDRGHYLVVHPKDTKVMVNSLLKIIEEENLYLHDLDLRKPSLNEIFEKIALEKLEERKPEEKVTRLP